MTEIAQRLLLTILFGALSACFPAPDYAGTVLEFAAYKNAGDLESTMALFADEPSLDFGPLGAVNGRSAIRGILEYDLALNAHLEFTHCETHDLEVKCRVVESNDWLKTVGIESIAYDENTFVFASDGRIRTVRATMSAPSAQSLGAALADFHEWATANRPEAYAELFSTDGAFVYSGENAGKVLALLRSWQDK